MPRQSLLTGAISLSAAQALVLILGYVTHLWIGRVLGPAAYGVYGVILSIQTIISLLLTLGIPVAVSRFVAQDEQHAQSILREAIWLQVGLALGVTLITLALSSVLATVLNDPFLTNYIRFVALIFIFQAFYPLYTQYLSGLHQFNKQALLSSVYAVAKLAGAIALLYPFHIYGAFAGFGIGGLVAALIGWFWVRRLGGQRPKKLPRRGFLEFAGTYVLILIGLQLLISLDLFMVKAILHNDVQAGYYNAAVTLSRISYFLLQALAFVLLPSVSALTKPGESHDKATAFIRDTLRYLIALIVPAVALAATTSKQLVLLFFSSKYLPAAPVLTILMVGLGALAFYLLLANIVAGAGKSRVALGITILLIGISAALGYVLIPRYGLLGAAWQTTIAGLVGLCLLTAYAVRTFGISLPIRSTINIVLASGVAILPTYFLHTPRILLPAEYVLLVTIYILALFLLGEITSVDRQHIANLHPKLKWLAV